MKSLLRHALACAGAVVLCPMGMWSASEQTVDIADFLVQDQARQWGVYSEGSFDKLPFTTSGSVRIVEVPDSEMFRLEILLNGSVFSMNHRLVMSLTETDLLLHSRNYKVVHSGAVLCEKDESYLNPVEMLPRQIQLCKDYTAVAESGSGEVEITTRIGGIEYVQNALGWYAETIQVELCPDQTVPVQLLLARDLGPFSVRVSTYMEGVPLVLRVYSCEPVYPWNPQTIHALWSDSCREADGWRSCDWLGYFWAPSVSSSWIWHYCLGWTYCDRDGTNLWFYLPEVDWFWTDESLYPIVYGIQQQAFLRYVESAGSYWFWNYSMGDYVNLDPAL